MRTCTRSIYGSKHLIWKDFPWFSINFHFYKGWLIYEGSIVENVEIGVFFDPKFNKCLLWLLGYISSEALHASRARCRQHLLWSHICNQIILTQIYEKTSWVWLTFKEFMEQFILVMWMLEEICFLTKKTLCYTDVAQ